MIGLGTLINVIGIVFGGLLGYMFGKFLGDNHQNTLTKSCGVCVLFIGIAGAMEGMLALQGDKIVSGSSMLLVISLALGGLIGEILNIEDGFEKFGEWLKIKTGNAKDKDFVNGFVTASLTVCIGAMAIVGSIQDGIAGDYSILATKAILDLIIIMVMTCSMGKGCVFSAIPVLIFQGSITIFASWLKPLMTDLALANISFVGSVLIFCVGLNLLWEKKIRVANLLPALIIAVIAAFI